MALQLHGGGGLSDDFPLAAAWIGARALRLADGPDEVHRGMVARLELGKYGADEPGAGHRRRVGARGGADRRRSGRAATRCWRRMWRARWFRDRRQGALLNHRKARHHLRRRLGGRARAGSRSAGAGSTSWSTTPASPAAAGSTSPGSTSGSGSSTINLLGRGPRLPHVRAGAQAAALGADRQRRVAGRAGAPGRDGVVQRGEGRRRRAHRDRSATSSRRTACTRTWSARRTSGPT